MTGKWYPNMLSQILTSVRGIDKQRVAKSGGVAVAISAGLTAASLAGVAIPVWGQTVGLVAGVIIYKLLPKKAEAEVDSIVDKVIDVTTEIPQTYADYGVVQQSPLEPTGNTEIKSLTNLNSGMEQSNGD